MNETKDHYIQIKSAFDAANTLVIQELNSTPAYVNITSLLTPDLLERDEAKFDALNLRAAEQKSAVCRKYGRDVLFNRLYDAENALIKAFAQFTLCQKGTPQKVIDFFASPEFEEAAAFSAFRRLLLDIAIRTPDF